MRTRLAAAHGVTTIELLLLVAIVGVLASMALPSFRPQSGKPVDSEAKALVRTAVVAVETVNGGGMIPADAAALVDVDPLLAGALNLTLSATASTFRVALDSAGGRTYWVERDGVAADEHGCLPAGAGGCSPAGTW